MLPSEIAAGVLTNVIYLFKHETQDLQSPTLLVHNQSESHQNVSPQTTINMDPQHDFYSVTLNPNTLNTTPYRKARSQGNALMCLPQEIRDEIYDWVFVGEDDSMYFVQDNTKSSSWPPSLTKTSKQLYKESQAAAFKYCPMFIATLEELAYAKAWLRSRKSCNAFEMVGTLITQDLGLFQCGYEIDPYGMPIWHYGARNGQYYH